MNTTTALPYEPIRPLRVQPRVAASGDYTRPSEPQPIILILALSLRMTTGFGAICGECLRRLIAHARAQITRQRHWSTEAAAIDADMTKHFPLLAECLANDPPTKRRKVWLAVKSWHARTHHLALEVDPRCPAHLMGD